MHQQLLLTCREYHTRIELFFLPGRFLQLSFIQLETFDPEMRVWGHTSNESLLLLP